MALVGKLLDKLGRKNDVEYEQASLRLVLGSLIVGYMFISTPAETWKFYLAACFGSLSAAMFFHVHIRPGNFPLRRLCGQLVDLVSVSAFLYLGGQSAAVVYCLYLWVIVGNGCRFGITYLATSTVIASIGFGYVVLNAPFWQQHGNLAAGLWITQLVVPGYLYGLLKRLNNATSRLERLSRYDELTGLLNRRAFNEQASIDFARLQREPAPFSIILVDIDHFKSINDRYGHLAGDIVLQKIARLLQDNCREVDFVSRFGGEEFALLTPGARKSHAVPLGERLRQAVSNEVIVIDENELAVTISIGIAFWSDEIETLNEWIDRADQALYQAKEAGRNRVVVTPEKDYEIPSQGLLKTC